MLRSLRRFLSEIASKLRKGVQTPPVRLTSLCHAWRRDLKGLVHGLGTWLLASCFRSQAITRIRQSSAVSAVMR